MWTAAPAIQKANAWFNAAQTMVGDFVQIGPDGRKSEGKIYVQRPGKLRFEYAQPATMEIVADGTSVIIRDRKLATQDTYFLAQTPLKFLLKDNIDLNKDVRVQAVTGDGATTSISVEDKATFGGTSHIRLTFDTKTSALTQWIVTDPQGYDTKVSLYNLDLARKARSVAVPHHSGAIPQPQLIEPRKKKSRHFAGSHHDVNHIK